MNTIVGPFITNAKIYGFASTITVTSIESVYVFCPLGTPLGGVGHKHGYARRS